MTLHSLTFSFSCPDSPTHNFPSESFKQTAVWPAYDPLTHFSKVSKPPHRPRILDIARKSPEWISSTLMFVTQGWGRCTKEAPMCFSRNPRLEFSPHPVFVNKGKTSHNAWRVPSIPACIRKIETPLFFTWFNRK